MAQGRQVDAALHAVTLDIRIDDEGRAVFLQAGQDIVYAQTGIGPVSYTHLDVYKRKA